MPPPPEKRPICRHASREDMFGHLIENMPVISYISPLKKNEPFFYLSPQCATLLGYDTKEMEEDLAFWQHHLHPDDRDRVLAIAARAWKEGERFSADYRMRAKSGRSLWFRDEALVIPSMYGKGLMFVGIMLDVTEQKETEVALAKSEERYRRLVAATSDYIYLVRLSKGEPVETIHSPASVAVTGYTPEEFRADPYLWITVVDERDREAVKKQIACVIGGKSPCSLEHRIRRKDGQSRWIRNTVVSQRDAAGRIISYDGLIVDITDRKTAEEKLHEAYAKLKVTQDQLIQAEKMEVIGRMASGVAHEVKNPLAIVVQGVNYLESQLPRKDPQIAEVLDFIKQGIDRADAIITSLCDFSKRSELKLAPGDINAIIRSSLVLVKSALKLGEIALREELEEGLPHVMVDARKMEQVFINLIRNAIQAMPAGGTLSLYSYLASREGGKKVVTVEIEDTGKGIAPEDLSHVFDPFFSTKGTKGGTGLGLFVTKNIVEMHCGTIELQSRQGHGTRAIIRLHVA